MSAGELKFDPHYGSAPPDGMYSEVLSGGKGNDDYYDAQGEVAVDNKDASDYLDVG